VTFGETCVVPHLTELRQHCPDLAVELVLTDANLDLVRDGIDLAIRLGERVEGDVIASKLLVTCYFVCASPAYVSDNGHTDRPVDLFEHDCLVFTLPGYRSHWMFRDEDGIEEAVPVRSGIAISNAQALRTAARAGLGSCLLADWLVGEDLTTGRLVDLFPRHDVSATSFETAARFVYPS